MAARQPVLELHPDMFFQVAAVPYRLSDNQPEFLLVRTGSGRWTFPKGHVDTSLGARESAVREALEEAGVEGSIARFPFGAYRASKQSDRGRKEFFIYAYLLRVEQQGQPAEANRTPSWFDAEDAKDLLRWNRSESEAAQIANIVNLATVTIRDASPARPLTLITAERGAQRPSFY